ncbi:MAG: DUF4250 domain-containing protein [Ruminococcaceae bacterium]|jgi:hypothetical protein|nr:DUF4250 domain-containing protein [Oscillospiraceae bacterium]
MNLPNDPFLLLSAVNTKLRDYYSSLDTLCDDLGENRTELEDKLAGIGYYYDEQLNQFVSR